MPHRGDAVQEEIMGFATICVLGFVTTGLFGLAFLVAPEATLQIYNVTGLNPGTTSIARLFGVELLATAAALVAVKPISDQLSRRRIAVAFAITTAIGTIVTVHAAATGAGNALMWSSVAIYGVFTVLWVMFAARQPLNK